MIDVQPHSRFEQIRAFAELLYFLSGIAIATFSWRALGQIDLLKKDIRLRNERAAKEQAIEACQRYFKSFAPLSRIAFEERVKKKISGYEGPYNSFDFGSWPQARKDFAWTRFKSLEDWLPALNELEGIAATFASGVGDETLGFEIIGATFCESVQSYFDILAIGHNLSGESASHYNSIIKNVSLSCPPTGKEATLGSEKCDRHTN